MSFAELLRTALHSLRINPIRSLLAILGVVFGVGAVVVLISMGQGVRTQISNQVRGLGTDLLIVKAGKEEAKEDQGMNPNAAGAQLSTSSLTEKDARDISAKKDYVLAATGTIEQVNEAGSTDGGNSKAVNVKVIGGDEEFRKVRELNFHSKVNGWEFEKQEDRTCAIGYTVKERLFGETTPDVEVLDKRKIRIGNEEFTVKAIASRREKSLFADPNREVYIPLKNARAIFGAADSDRVLEIYAKAKNAGETKEAKSSIVETVRKSHNGADDFFVATQDDLIASYNKIFSILSALVIGVALVALAESGIGVSNIMYIAVKERTREIGVRLAQGASSRAILTQFLFESVTLCLVGSAIGIPLGCFVALIINKYTVLPAQTPLWGVLVAFAAGTLVGVMAGVYPAWQATKSDIAVVLRAE